jgi:hypothetical protein
MKLNKEYLTKNKIVIHCSSKTQSNSFLRIIKELGFQWHFNDNYWYYNEWNSWEHHKENTCYTFNNIKGKYIIGAGHINYFKSNHSVINFKINRCKEIVKKYFKSERCLI